MKLSLEDTERESKKNHWWHIPGKFWTISNVLSLIRMLLVFPIAYLIYIDGSVYWLLGLVALAVITDWLDGKIARWTGTVSEWGKVLDPLADKLGSALVGFVLALKGILPWWFVVLVVVRDVLIMIGGVLLMRRLGRVVPSIWMGKVAVTFLALTILAGLLKADPEIMQVLINFTSFLLVFSFALYVRRFIKLWNLEEGYSPEYLAEVLSAEQKPSMLGSETESISE